MFKSLPLILLAGLFALPVVHNQSMADTSASFKDEPNSLISANPNWDEELIEDDGWVITRIYRNSSFAPKLNKAFSAPSGYAFYLTLDDNTLNKIGNEIRLIPGLNYDIFSIYFGYTFLGNSVDSLSPIQYNADEISDYGFEDPVEGIKECIRSSF